MSIPREWLNRLRHLRSPSRLEQDLDAEIQFHIETRACEIQISGIPWHEAVAQARREFGSDARMREESRAAWQPQWLEDMARDLRYAIRVFRAGRGFSLIAILSLGLAIGINTVAYTFYEAIGEKPLPVKSPEQIVRVSGHQSGAFQRRAHKNWYFVDQTQPRSGMFHLIQMGFEGVADLKMFPDTETEVLIGIRRSELIEAQARHASNRTSENRAELLKLLGEFTALVTQGVSNVTPGAVVAAENACKNGTVVVRSAGRLRAHEKVLGEATLRSPKRG